MDVDAVGDFEHMRHVVRDEDDRHAALLDVKDELEPAARATATPWRWPPDSVSTGWWMFWIVISPSSLSFSRANFPIFPRSVARNHCPMKPGMRGSRPRNMLSAIDSAGDRARV